MSESEHAEVTDRDQLRGRYWNDAVDVVADAAAHRLGSKGLFIRADGIASAGNLLHFELTVGDEPPLTGVVRVVERYATGEGPEGEAGLHVKFVQIDDLDHARAVLARVAVATSPSIPPPPPSGTGAGAGAPSSRMGAGEKRSSSSGNIAAFKATRTGTSSSSIAAVQSDDGSTSTRTGKRSKSSGSHQAVASSKSSGSHQAVGRGDPAVATALATKHRAHDGASGDGLDGFDSDLDVAPSSHAGAWEAAMELDDEFFDHAPPSSRPFADEPSAESIRAADPAYQERQQKLRRTFGLVVAGACILLGAVVWRATADEPEAAARPLDTPARDTAAPEPPPSAVSTTVAVEPAPSAFAASSASAMPSTSAAAEVIPVTTASVAPAASSAPPASTPPRPSAAPPTTAASPPATTPAAKPPAAKPPAAKPPAAKPPAARPPAAKPPEASDIYE